MAIWNAETTDENAEAFSFKTDKDFIDYDVEKQSMADTQKSSTNPYTCKICGNHFKTASNLTIHMAIHSYEEPYSCDVRGKCFKRFEHVRDHKTLHT